jgi:hypothetical protein
MFRSLGGPLRSSQGPRWPRRNPGNTRARPQAKATAQAVLADAPLADEDAREAEQAVVVKGHHARGAVRRHLDAPRVTSREEIRSVNDLGASVADPRGDPLGRSSRPDRRPRHSDEIDRVHRRASSSTTLSPRKRTPCGNRSEGSRHGRGIAPLGLGACGVPGCSSRQVRDCHAKHGGTCTPARFRFPERGGDAHIRT